MEKSPDKEAEQLLREVDEFLAENEVHSEGELPFLLRKIDTAIAINNSPKAHEMRKDLIERYGKEVRKL